MTLADLISKLDRKERINNMIDLRLGDCVEIMSTMEDKSVDLILCDPPYGLNYEYNSYNDSLENLIYLVNRFMPEATRISKRLVTFCGVQNVWIYPQADWIMSYSWDTTAKYGAFGYNQWQPILLYGKDIKGFGSINDILKSDSIKYSGGSGIGFLADYKDKKHPCPKPLNIMEYLVRRFSDENEIVLDCFMGSGTTGVACIKLNRNFIGIEKDEIYFKIAQKRINDIKNVKTEQTNQLNKIESYF